MEQIQQLLSQLTQMDMHSAANVLYALCGACLLLLITTIVFARRSHKRHNELEELQASHGELRNEQQALDASNRDLEVQFQRLQVKHEGVGETLTIAQQQLSSEGNKLTRAIDSQHDAERLNHGLKAELRENKVRQDDLQRRLGDMQARLDELSKLETALTAQNTELKTTQTQREEIFAQQTATLSENFKVLANDIFEAKTKSLHENSKESLTSIINPFRQQITEFKKEVHEIHHRETVQQGELRKELGQLKELNQQITLEAHELSTALRGQKKLQGNWGELILENVLDRSGLVLGKDYQREVSITTEHGRQRPDAIVYLPQEKHLVIDAKVSLNAYTNYVNAQDDVQRAQSLKEHVAAMSARINELADRDYYKLPGLNSPEMVFMFVPIESAFVEALKADETLFTKAIENNVLVATPTTLLTSLNIVRQLWRYEDQNKHTVALARKAEGVFRKLNSFLGSFEDIKKNLDRASESYVRAEGQLLRGKGNLVKQVGEFKNLAPAIKAELPAYFTEKAALEIDYIPGSGTEDGAADLDNPESNGGTNSDATDDDATND